MDKASDDSEFPRILIIDDDQEVRDVFGEYFRDRRYVVQDAANGGDALMLLRESPPDVVLLDIHMPGKSGLELLPDILAVTPPIPVIMVTANTDVALAQEALRLGACDYVTKPCDFDHLEVTVRTALLPVNEPQPLADAKQFQDEERWAALMHAVLDAVQQMGDRGRMSMRERLQNAVVMALRAARHGDGLGAERHLREVELVLRVATELGDVPLAATLAVEAARAQTPRAVSEPPTSP
jgi:DNA-binding response OmpR family regulator